jgi:chromosome segregation protein
LYLKRMELFGFKSFADKSELGLSPGIAAIIGPNGCGKSNLVDAVRWALGEQSVKSLRGTKMEEIIFSGSESRKALNFAEVSLTFDGAGQFLNLDYDEITITRRLFRNGDSEYYINKTPCRLKDIAEMFMDTGLGKDVYSVIGQGRVDEIINSRPEERREIFEEAAGIFKYKLRKKEARRRLDETRENLVRVQDLIFELENQVEPLQTQAEITRQYRALQKQIEEEEKKLLSYQLRKTRSDLEKINRQLQSVNDALLTSAVQGGQQEKELQDLKNNLFDQQQARKEEEFKYNQRVRTQEQLEAELKLVGERENRFRENIEQNRQRIEQLTHLMQEYADQKKKTENDQRLKQAELKTMNEELNSRKEELSRHKESLLAQEVELLQEEIYKAGARKEAAELALSESRRRFGKIKLQKSDLDEEINRLTEEKADLDQVLKNYKLKITEAYSMLEAGQDKEKSEQEQEEQLKQELNRLVTESNLLREKLHGVKSRLQLLVEQDSALTGYYRGVKEIVQARSKLPGIIGPVADLINVEDLYVQAIESALGSGLQYLVAETEKAVRDAILFLKEKNRGWATFLPLDIIHQAADPLERFPGWRNLEGVIGKASELVKAEAAYRKAIDYLLSPILVCRSLEDASQAARFVKHSCRVVTLEGEMINPGGIIRGGSLPTRNAGMPLGRRKEIENLKQQLDLLNKDLTILDSKVEGLSSQLSKQKQNVLSATTKNKELSELHGSLISEMEKKQLEQDSLTQRLESAQTASRAFEEEIVELTGRQDQFEAEIGQSSREISKSESKLAIIKEDYRNYMQQKDNLEQAVTTILIKISSCREQHEGLLEKINDINSNSQKPANEIMEKENELEKHQQELAENEEAKRQIVLRIEELNSEKADLMIELDRKNSLVSQLEAELIEFEEQGRLRQSRITRQEKRERQLSLDQAKLQTELNYQEIHFRDLFHSLELVETAEEYDPELSRQIIENLRDDSDALGEVNLGAIEELTRLEERINFLTEQKDDLHRGEKSLNKVLAEIDQRMEYYFSSAFDQINTNFKQTFSELFEGGQVLLKLTDEEIILESGIEIIAQPPGKKLQNITLLSAGEKVLTAIALVFAILRFKPAPFYLMDEVESTLDDANLARFTKFLKQNSKQAQFIMITHRRRTMEEAGVLYGVTMPEAGVSRMMSLRLEDCAVAGGN